MKQGHVLYRDVGTRLLGHVRDSDVGDRRSGHPNIIVPVRYILLPVRGDVEKNEKAGVLPGPGHHARVPRRGHERRIPVVVLEICLRGRKRVNGCSMSST